MLRCLLLIITVATISSCVPFNYEYFNQTDYDGNKSLIKRQVPNLTESATTANQSNLSAGAEDEVSPGPEQYPPIESKFTMAPFLIGSFITVVCFLLLIVGLCLLLRPTGRFCDNFLKKPGEIAYAKRKRQEKKLAKASKKQQALKKEEKHETAAQKKEMREAQRLEDKHKDREEAEMLKQRAAERKERQKERTLVAKEKERRRRDQEKAKRARQDEINKELKQKLREQERKDREAFKQEEEALKRQERDLKGSDEQQTHHADRNKSDESKRRSSQPNADANKIP